MILLILAAWFGYKKASASGRNGILWAFISAGVFIGTQLAVGILAGIGIAFGEGAFGWSESLYDDLTWPINFVAIAASILGIYLVFRFLARLPGDEAETVQAPPPPPQFFEAEPAANPEDEKPGTTSSGN